jgi:hypothetical protein
MRRPWGNLDLAGHPLQKVGDGHPQGLDHEPRPQRVAPGRDVAGKPGDDCAGSGRGIETSAFDRVGNPHPFGMPTRADLDFLGDLTLEAQTVLVFEHTAQKPQEAVAVPTMARVASILVRQGVLRFAEDTDQRPGFGRVVLRCRIGRWRARDRADFVGRAPGGPDRPSLFFAARRKGRPWICMREELEPVTPRAQP